MYIRIEEIGRKLNMGVKNLVSIVPRICRSAFRHPLLVCSVFVTIWFYRSFPLMFSLLVHLSPVIASTLILLGALLFYGDANAHEIGDQKYHVNPLNANHNYKFGSCQSRGISYNNNNTSDEDNIVESLSPSGSVADIYSILDELGPLSESDVPFPNVSTDQSHESTEYVNETDDDKESVITWTGEEQRDAAGSERKQVLENLIARQRTLKNMRMLAEQNMASMSPHLKTKIENNVGFVIPRRYSYDPSGQKPDRAGPTFQPDSPRRHSFDPSRHRVGPTFRSNAPRHHERFDVGPSTGLRDTWDIREYYIQRSQFLENNESHQGDDKEVNIRGGNRGYEKTSSGKYYFDASDGDEEEEYTST